LNTNLYLLLENLLFLVLVTSFIVIVGWGWRHSKPFSLPEPLPEWFKVWFGTVQVVGVLLPLLAMLVWGVWWGYSSVLTVLSWYFVMLGLQILSEILTLRQFHSVVWVMVPYLYLPYRIWQLYEGLTLLSPEPELIWIRNLFTCFI
jgi:polyferredoxin